MGTLQHVRIVALRCVLQIKQYLGHNLATEACKPLAELTSPDIIVGCNHFEPANTLSNNV